MHFKTTAAVAALCACGFLAGCNQQQASAPPAAPAANQPAAAVPPATEQTSLTPTQGPANAADTTPAANKKFLDDNGKRDGVKTTQDGLQYRVIKAGTGKTPTAPTDNVTVLYKGQLITGQVFEHVAAEDVIAAGELGGGEGEAQPPAAVPPYNESYAVQFGNGCNDVYRQTPQSPVDPGMVSVHSQRAAWDYYSGAMSWDESYKKHINEFRAVYGLPPL